MYTESVLKRLIQTSYMIVFITRKANSYEKYSACDVISCAEQEIIYTLTHTTGYLFYYYYTVKPLLSIHPQE